ncbi:MAG: hypothetical protein POELPBGB_03977 [Bacteroidia bacterium]|nr:hypothetical protein [Bacteroidia bacterium]
MQGRRAEGTVVEETDARVERPQAAQGVAEGGVGWGKEGSAHLEVEVASPENSPEASPIFTDIFRSVFSVHGNITYCKWTKCSGSSKDIFQDIQGHMILGGKSVSATRRQLLAAGPNTDYVRSDRKEAP